jgi:hypothetical protein
MSYSSVLNTIIGSGNSGYSDAPVPYNLADLARQMNAVSSISCGDALSLLGRAQTAINLARAFAAAGNLPGGANRDQVAALITAQQNQLATCDPNDDAGYSDLAGLKQVVTMAFTEANAAATGDASRISQVTSAFSDTLSLIASLPENVVPATASFVGSAVNQVAVLTGDAASNLLGGLFSDPMGVAVLLAVGFGAFLYFKDRR